jgi:pSer/pThr/pTyr-binding forkhead associated (FHA) protein
MDAPILRLDRYDRPPAASPARFTLEITRGKAQQRIRPVQGKVFLIGTASDCDLVLGDLSFPEVYAYLFVDGSKIGVRRLGAGPALVVSGERADRAELFHGDEVQFGPFGLRVLIEPAMTDAPAPEDDLVEEDDPACRLSPAVLRFSPRERCSL